MLCPQDQANKLGALKSLDCSYDNFCTLGPKFDQESKNITSFLRLKRFLMTEFLRNVKKIERHERCKSNRLVNAYFIKSKVIPGLKDLIAITRKLQSEIDICEGTINQPEFFTEEKLISNFPSSAEEGNSCARSMDDEKFTVFKQLEIFYRKTHSDLFNFSM